MKQREIEIRQERPEEFACIKSLVKEAFASAMYSDGDEHNLIDRIRQTNEYIPELSLVAINNNEIVGYIMLSKIYVGETISVAPAPLAVDSRFQRMGIGKLLINKAHDVARKLKYPYSIVLGSPEYYGQFGYHRASESGIKPPFEVDDEYYMVRPLDENNTIKPGIVKYSKAFGLN